MNGCHDDGLGQVDGFHITGNRISNRVASFMPDKVRLNVGFPQRALLFAKDSLTAV